MAQTGKTPISLYYSTTGGNTPTAGNLVDGELAINTADGKLFYKDSSGVVQTIASKAGNVNVSSFSGGSTGLTPNTATTGAVTLAGTLAIGNGGTGQTTASAAFNALSPVTTTGDLIIGNGTNSSTRLGIGTNGQVLTSNGTTATWASASGGRSGVTTVTLTSASPSATLTSSTNQLVKIVTDTTVPVAPSIVLPNMTTLATGSGYFYFNNATPFVIAVKDAGGTVREYLQPNSTVPLNILSIATSNGTWNLNNPPSLCATEYNQITTLSANFRVNTAGYVIGTSQLIRISDGYVVMVWIEYNEFTGGNYYGYAQLFGINSSTRAVTAYNRVTLFSNYTSATGFLCDFDNAGHALVSYTLYNSAGATTAILGLSGLSVSGTTLYVTNNTSISQGGAGCGATAYMDWNLCAYLGADNAFAISYAQGDGGGGAGKPSTYVRSVKVTGTTTVTVTLGTAVGTGSTVDSNTTRLYCSRVNATTFTTCNYFRTGVSSYAYSPYSVVFTTSTNSVAVTARTSYTRPFDSEIANGTFASFNYGYSYCNGKTLYAGTSYDVTGSGATLLLSPSTSITARTSGETTSSLVSVNGLQPFGTSRTTYLNSASSYTSLDLVSSSQTKQYSYLNVDPTSSVYNMVKAPPLNTGVNIDAISNSASAYLNPVFNDSTTVISGAIVNNYNNFSAYIYFTPIATGLF